MWFIHTMKYHSAITGNKTLIHAARWMDFKHMLRGQNPDSGEGTHRVCVSPHLGCSQGAGGRSPVDRLTGEALDVARGHFFILCYYSAFFLFYSHSIFFFFFSPTTHSMWDPSSWARDQVWAPEAGALNPNCWSNREFQVPRNVNHSVVSRKSTVQCQNTALPNFPQIPFLESSGQATNKTGTQS